MKTKDQFPVGTLLSSDCWSILVLAWSGDGKRATIMFQDGYIATCCETYILHFSKLDDTQVFFPHQP